MSEINSKLTINKLNNDDDKEEIVLPCFDIKVILSQIDSGETIGCITSGLCDFINPKNKNKNLAKAEMLCLERIILNHAIAGEVIDGYAYIEGIERTVSQICETYKL